jgi:hypothetical protein
MPYQTALQQAVVTDATIIGLIAPPDPNGNPAMWYKAAPPGAVMPYIVFFSTGGPGPEYTFEKDYTEGLQLQISPFSELAATTENIAKRIDQLLNWQTLTIDTARLMKFERTSPLDDLDMDEAVDENDVDVFYIHLLYEMTLIRTL